MYLSKLNITKPGRLIACALIASAIAAPAAGAMPVGSSSPDARDAATPQVNVGRPDSWDAAESRTYAGDAATPQVNVGRPDSWDSAESPTYVEATPQNVAGPEPGGFDLSTAGISVAAFAGLLIVSIGGMSLVRQRNRQAVS